MKHSRVAAVSIGIAVGAAHNSRLTYSWISWTLFVNIFNGRSVDLEEGGEKIRTENKKKGKMKTKKKKNQIKETKPARESGI